jgi:putative transposase
MLKNKRRGGEILKITVKIKLSPKKEEIEQIKTMSLEYISSVNTLVQSMVDAGKSITYSSKDFTANLPSAVKAQCTLDAKSVYIKHKKKVTKTLAVLKKPVCVWNNQNYSIDESSISFPVWIGKSKKIAVRAEITEEQKQLLQGKLGTLRITRKRDKWIAQVAVEVAEKESKGNNSMGVDLGLKVPAVAVTNDSKVKFAGNGRQNKYMKRKNRANRKKLGKAKKLNAIKKSKDKEQRWMQDQDHKISRQIVNFAKQNNVSKIKLEKLANIRNTARTSRKNEKNLHTWSFYRLAQYIEYKAQLEGILVEYVNPKYTSQKCPMCGTLNKAKDRKYQCKCGFKTHRDILGARNIINAPVVDGKSLSA